MIIDAHIHFYESRRPGVGPTSVSDHLPFDEVLQQARAVGIDKITQVTPYAVGYDNSYSFVMADRYPDDVVGVIARLDPVAPDIEPALRQMMRHPRMLALRLTLIEPESVGYLVHRTLDPFFTLAGERGLPIELFAPFQVPMIHETVRRFPAVSWLIGHMGLRNYAGQQNKEPFRQWRTLLALAEEPNAWIKCSYFPEAACDLERYPFQIAREQFRQLHDHVGAGRLIWGSDFPNVRRACTYREALDFVRIGCDFLSASERDAVLGKNFLSLTTR
jgi:predicted TIM-barrel fold metal-dependent hydrolase